MPFGLTNAPTTFQRLIDSLFGPEMEPNVFGYLDDIIIATDTSEEHQKWLEIVLTKIRDAQLTVNWKKCEFGCSRVRYLGYLLDQEGLNINTLLYTHDNTRDTHKFYSEFMRRWYNGRRDWLRTRGMKVSTPKKNLPREKAERCCSGLLVMQSDETVPCRMLLYLSPENHLLCRGCATYPFP